MKPQVASYQEGWTKGGHKGRGKAYDAGPIYDAETDRQARDEARESVEHFYRLQYELIAESARRSGRQAFIDRAEHLRTLTYDDALRGNVIVGSPDTVAKRLKALQDEIGFDGILAELNCGGIIPHDRVMNALRLLCEEVKPRFQSVRIAGIKDRGRPARILTKTGGRDARAPLLAALLRDI